MLLSSWNSNYIDCMRIAITEDFRMEILALLTMKAPKDFTCDSIQKAKRDVLRCLQKDSNSTFFINTPEWRGVAFYIDESQCDQGVMIEYKKSIFPKNKTSKGNGIFLSFESKGGFDIYINSIKPGLYCGRNPFVMIKFSCNM
jgi:glucose-6-phosphate 1-dehydrogenase